MRHYIQFEIYWMCKPEPLKKNNGRFYKKTKLSRRQEPRYNSNRNILACQSELQSIALKAQYIKLICEPWLAFLKCLPCLLCSVGQQTALYQVDQVLAQQDLWYLPKQRTILNSHHLLTIHFFLLVVRFSMRFWLVKETTEVFRVNKRHTRSKALFGSKTNIWPR